IGRAQVEGYRDHLRQQEYGDSTIRKYVGALGTMYRWAIGCGLLADNPAAGVKRPAEPSRIVAVLSREEEVALLPAADGETRLAIDLYLASGMRLSEARDLRWPQIDRHGGAILINKSKTGKARSIPLNARLIGILDRCTRHVRSDYVLCDREGNQLGLYILPRRIESAMERAGIEKKQGAILNLLRHTFGSRMAEAGVSFGTIATIMGNSAVICEKHYIKFSPGHLKAAMATQDVPATVAQDGARTQGEAGSGRVGSVQAVDQ
ncbi:MAG: tyrosine-type recombinase/integrase, partial [Acidobacteria bacterium]|nr:tyrosine-type recombinase/integrase [Acidobacteriota bacterium]